jgi:hypothetical protein
MKKLLTVFVVALSILYSRANATVLKYNFTLSLNYVTERDGITGGYRNLATSEPPRESWRLVGLS